MPQLAVEAFLVLTSDTTNCKVQNHLHSHQSPGVLLKQFKPEKSKSNFKEVTAAFKLHAQI